MLPHVGVPELMIIVFILLPVVAVPLIGLALAWKTLSRRARRFGYASMGAYLKAAPRSDAERRDAADLMLIGVAVCTLGLILAPLALVGLVPLFFGGRKVMYATMGLGLIDDTDSPGE